MNLATMIRPRPAWGAWATLCMALALPLGAGAQASAPRPGSYETEGGWGQLTIKSGNRPGTLGFSIEAIGGNAHTCSVGGTLQGDRGVADDETGPEACAIRFTARGDRIEVKPLTPENCRTFCGARASFDGTYLLPPEGCRPAQRKARRAVFLSAYQARRHAEALSTLSAFQRECGALLSWLEVDRVRNDLAVTLHHLGRDDECLAQLKATRGAQWSTEAEVREGLPPSDADAYLSVAKATWTNQRLCGRKPGG